MVIYFSVVFFCKQKTAYELRMSDWSSDVCSSDLIVTTALVAASLFALVRLTVKLVNRSIQRTSSLDPLQRVLVQTLAGIGIVVFAVIFAIDLLGIDLTSLAVFSGALGLAVGFGLQKTSGNLIAGLILLMDTSIRSEEHQ